MTTAQQLPATSQRDSLRTILTDTFEGVALTCVEIDGRPAYIAREIGAALGYADNGAAFADRVTRSWSEELVRGRDFDVLEGEALDTFKALTVDATASRTRNLLVLFEHGLHIALLKTRKPSGVRLRAWLAEHAMPALARGKAIDADGEVTSPHPAPSPLSTAELRERRLSLRETRLVIDRMVKAGEITEQAGARILREAFVEFARGHLSPEAMGLAQAVERLPAVEQRLLPARVPPDAVLLPEEAQVVSRAWLSPTQISAKLGMPGSRRLRAQRVGIAITGIGKARYFKDGAPDQDGLRTDTRFARRAVVNKQGAGDTLQVSPLTGEPDLTYGYLYDPLKVPPMVKAWLLENHPHWLLGDEATPGGSRLFGMQTRMTR